MKRRWNPPPRPPATGISRAFAPTHIAGPMAADSGRSQLSRSPWWMRFPSWRRAYGFGDGFGRPQQVWFAPVRFVVTARAPGFIHERLTRVASSSRASRWRTIILTQPVRPFRLEVPVMALSPRLVGGKVPVFEAQDHKAGWKGMFGVDPHRM